MQQFIKTYSIGNRIEISKLSDFLLSKEEEILNRYPYMSDFGTKLNDTHVSTRSCAYNIFDYATENTNLETLFNFIQECYWDYVDNILSPKHFTNDQLDPAVSGWLNVIRSSENIGMHKHSEEYDLWSFISGTMSICVFNTSTYYKYGDEIIEIENKEGEITLFPPYYLHWTTIHNNDIPRITLGFDVLFRYDHSEPGALFTQNLRKFLK